MTTKGSSRRVLRFAVTGMLLGSGLSCDSAKDAKPDDKAKASEADKKTDAKKTDAKTGDPETPIAVNPGPALHGGDAGAPKTGDPAEPVEKVNPGPEPTPETDKAPIEERVNEGPVDEPKPEPVAKPEPEPKPDIKKPKYVNTRRVEEPKAP